MPSKSDSSQQSQLRSDNEEEPFVREGLWNLSETSTNLLVSARKKTRVQVYCCEV